MKKLAALGLTLFFAGCAAPPPQKVVAQELFAVIPGNGGHVGSIVVERGGQRHVIDQPFGAQRVHADGALVADKLTSDEVRQSFGATLESLPGKPASFLLYFLEGRDELTVESRREIDKVFSELKRRPLPDIVVIGHTDTVGGLAFNDKLARAERLRVRLVGLGITAERIQAAGRGKREPLVPTDDNVSEPRNRRVEINVR